MDLNFKNQPPFVITEKALHEIDHIIKEKNIPENYHLRIGIKGGGGCGGATFLIGFDTQKEGDDVFLFNDVTVLMEKKHAMFLVGKEIDFEDGAVAKGFVFK